MSCSHTIITLDEAELMLAASLHAASSRRLAVSIAVVDAAGSVVAVRRLDGARPVTVPVALAKAYSSAVMGCDSGDLEVLATDQPTVFAAMSSSGPTPLVSGLGGRVILDVDGLVRGAIGVSGSRPDEDDELAGLAVAALPDVTPHACSAP
ncbi:heme-binding protein [Aeromicrobium sp.]|jgi:glc operon protein GlcG|uniref:GlcG/HbpS family heme-binding protein n=1 Tax=Aeromicrobium sp. TaxID=1871063 RepID=UPI0025B83880|nr:heme-binding protein [Aeromicrobium sp.]MCK5890296.1 heme-binding protein [Aeromicrobium sp.]